MAIHGAKITAGSQTFPTLDTSIEETSFGIELCYLEWSIKSDVSTLKNGPVVNLPVYKDSTRKHLLFKIDFNVIGSEQQYYERGVALVSSS